MVSVRSPAASLASVLLLAAGASACATPAPRASAAEVVEHDTREGIDARLRREGSERNGQVDHFAVLIGGATELRHRGNLSMAYQVLIEQGYSRDHVYILDSDGDTMFFPSTDVATRANVEALFAHLRKIVEPEDTLLIYVTGHGRRVQATEEEHGLTQTLGVSTILLNKTEELADWEFARLLDGLEPAIGIAFFDQCYGAVFATTSRSCNFVFITTAAETDTSYGVSFPRAFWGAFRKRPRGALSVLDAYVEATREDRGTIRGYNSPQLVHRCVDPSRISLLGAPRDPPAFFSAKMLAPQPAP